MLKSEALLLALNEADAQQLEETRRRLGYAAGARRTPRRKLWRTLLLAAVIAAFMGVTAYAAGWIGLDSLHVGRLFGTEVISMEGLAESNEGKALAEWLAYYDEHRTEPYDAAEAWSLMDEYGQYGVTSREMADKVDEICRKYDLRKLGKMTVPEDEKSYWKAAGVGKLTRGTDTMENDFLSGYVYPDGTFQYDGVLYPAGENHDIMYEFRSSAKGTFGYVTMNVGDAKDYEEWSYKTSSGQTLTLANSKNGSLILLDTRDSFVVASFAHGGRADYLGDGILDGVGDERVTFEISRGELEEIAESFNWDALRDSDAGMDGPFTYHEFTGDGAASLLTDEIDLDTVKEADRYFISLAYTEQIAPYVRSFELVDYELRSWGRETTGWICFKAQPRKALDWNRIPTEDGEIFCRSLNLNASGEEGAWLAGEAFDMLPYPMLSDSRNLGTEEEPDWIWLGQDLSDLTAATLHVTQTGKDYTLSKPADLALVKQLLTVSEIPQMSDSAGWNPLYLSFADGGHAVVYTAGDGSNSVCLFGGWQPYGLGASIFEVFGVPLDAAGYRSHDGVVTTRFDAGEGLMVSWSEIDYEENGPMIARRVMSDTLREAHWEYDDSGRCQRMYWQEGETLTRDVRYTYDREGRLILTEETDHSNPSFWAKTVYEYDAQGRLTAEIHTDNDDPPGWTGGNVYYAYDADGNCRVTMGWVLEQEKNAGP